MHTLLVLHFRDGVSICETHYVAQGWPLTLRDPPAPSPQGWHYRVRHYVQINAHLIYVSKDRPDLALGLQLSISDLIPQGFGVSVVNTELLWCEI